MRILLADDHVPLRIGLKAILKDAFPQVRFGEAGTCARTLEMAVAEVWDLLILDIFMPDRGGLEVLQEVHRQRPDLPVLVLTSAAEDQMAVRVLREGASGYINKRVAPEELATAVERVVSGKQYVSPAVAELLARELREPAKSPQDRLTNREQTVLRELMTGRSISEVAVRLNLSPKTVSTYHTRIWNKLGVRSDVAMARYALEHRLLDDS